MKHRPGKGWNIVLNKKLPLRLDTVYTLEAIHLLSTMALNRMCWRFDVSGWVGNVPSLLREAICNIPRFMGLYHLLTIEQQAILSALCESAGSAALVESLYQQFSKKMSKELFTTTIKKLVQEGWLLEGDNPHVVLAVAEFKSTLRAIPAFHNFLNAQLPPEQTATIRNHEFFSDLVEMAAFIYVEKPKLTAKGFMSKAFLRRLSLRLSSVATRDWEEKAVEGFYTSKMLMLLSALQRVCAVQVAMDQIDSRYYDFNAEKWDDFIFLPATHRLISAISWEFSRIHTSKRGSLPFVASLLQNAAEEKGYWWTAASLMKMSIIPESSVTFVERDPFGSEEWLELIVLEPLMYLGLFEKTTEVLPTPWLKEEQKTRSFWRLTPLGMVLGQWFSEQRKPSEAITELSKIEIGNNNIDAQFVTLFEKFQEILPVELEGQLVIQPDLSFFVPRLAPPYLLWMLSVFGSTQVQDYVYQGSFTRDSILRALKGGVVVSELFEIIADHSKVPPAESVLSTLKQWAATYDRTIFASATLLACDTPEMASEIVAQSKLASLIIGQIGIQTLLIQPGSESTIRKWLDKKNWVPRPGIASADTLYKWLNKS